MTYDPKEMHGHRYELSSGGSGGTWLIAAGVIILLMMGALTIFGGFAENTGGAEVAPAAEETPGIVPAGTETAPVAD